MKTANPRFGKIMSKLSMDDLKGKAQEVIGKLGADFGKLFGK